MIYQTWHKNGVNNESEYDLDQYSMICFILADYLASTGSLKHSKTKYHNINVGENLRSQSWPITGSY